MRRILIHGLIIAIVAAAATARADEPAQKTTPEIKLPAPSEVKKLRVEPTTIKRLHRVAS